MIFRTGKASIFRMGSELDKCESQRFLLISFKITFTKASINLMLPSTRVPCSRKLPSEFTQLISAALHKPTLILCILRGKKISHSPFSEFFPFLFYKIMWRNTFSIQSCEVSKNIQSGSPYKHLKHRHLNICLTGTYLQS